MKRLWLTIFLMFATLGVALGQTTTTSLTTSDPDGTAWNAGTYSIQYINSIPGKPYNTSTGAFITTLYTGSLNSSGAVSLTLDDVKYISPANGTWAFTICPNVSGGSSNCSTIDIPVTGATENVSSLVNAALRAPRPGGGVGAYGYADVEFQSIPGNTYVVSPALTVQRCYAGSWAACGSGGGSSLPTAPTGSIITNTSGSTTYAGQANIFYQQSGDTIASIEAACSSACTYVVTSPQTITLAASHAMNSNVWLKFEADGSWTVNGATFVLSNVQVAPGTTATDHFPAGSGTLKLGLYNTVVPVEWFGAVAGGSASTNLTAIQAAVNSLTAGQVKFSGMYSIAGTVAFPNGIGAQGIPAFRGGVPSSYLSGLTETVAGDDAIDQHGTSGSFSIGGKFQDFAVLSSVAQTGTAAGISCSFAGGLIASNLFVQDFIYDVYAHACPSYGGPGWNGVATQHSGLITSGNVYGWFLDSGDGYPESSITIRNSGYDDASNGSHTSTAMLIQGTAINDVNVFNFNVAQPSGWGVHINSTAFSALAASDLHFVSLTVDGSAAGAVPVELDGVAGSAGGTITFTDARLSTSNHPAEIFYIYQSNNIQLLGSQLDGGQIGVKLYAGGSTGNVIANNVILDNSSEAIYNDGVQNVISGNSIGGTTTTGLWFLSGSSNNTYGLNTCASGVTTCVSDNGTGNGLSAPISIAKSGTTGANVLQMTIPSLATGTGDYVGMYMGTTVALNNLLVMNFTNAGGSGSSSNYANFGIYNSGSTYEDAWPNGSFTFGQTTPAAGPANGICVGTTCQFQVSGAGAVTAPSVISGGTTFTASGCTNSTLVGGATAGSYDSGTSGTCTVTVTMGGSLTAPHGWSCSVHDLTTPADTQTQTATAAGTATFSGTTVTGDVVNFGCIGY